MIIRLPVPQSLVEKIQIYLKTHTLANRGFEDGNYKKQEVGLIGELMLIEFLTNQIPELDSRESGFDGGFDIEYAQKKIDVKTMERKSYVRPNYVNNFYLLQKDYISDTLVFCSYHGVDHVLEICGWIPKNELSSKGKFYPAGTKRSRADGSFFLFRQDNYEIENKNLNPINTLKK